MPTHILRVFSTWEARVYCCGSDVCVCMSLWWVCAVYIQDTEWRRPIGCRIFTGHFPQKSPTGSGSIAENDLQLNVYIRDSVYMCT